ncbi:helix-turn-helix domain-containing protein [Saccharopolyspora sp. 5N102]|uniref:helix-turn-helix domain-containing protein n=1 Tax=Saccharopolyspora sp. 5N102 TaxID=3375155 RepID=UPI0037A9A629
MKANTAARFRLYPNQVQAERLTVWSHTCRAVWNIALAQRIWAYKLEGPQHAPLRQRHYRAARPRHTPEGWVEPKYRRSRMVRDPPPAWV